MMTPEEKRARAAADKRRWRAENPDAARAARQRDAAALRRKRAENPEILAAHNAETAAWKAANPGYMAEYMVEWRKDHPNYQREYRKRRWENMTATERSAFRDAENARLADWRARQATGRVTGSARTYQKAKRTGDE